MIKVYEIERMAGAAPVTITVAGTSLTFESRPSPAHGALVVSAIVVADAPEAPAVLAWANLQVQRRRMARVSEATIEGEPPAPTVRVEARAAQPGRAPASLLTLAAMAGWDILDLVGCGTGPAAGNRGALSGLTLGELAATAPPAGWPERRANEWPWQVAGWSAPFAGWSAPADSVAKPANGLRVVMFTEAIPDADVPITSAPKPGPVEPVAAEPATAAEPIADVPEASPAPSADGAAPVAPSDAVAAFMARVLTAAAGEDGPRASAARLLVERQAELNPQALDVLLAVPVGSRGAPPIGKLRAALTQAHLPPLNDEILQAVGLLLR